MFDIFQKNTNQSKADSEVINIIPCNISRKLSIHILFFEFNHVLILLHNCVDKTVKIIYRKCQNYYYFMK